MGFFIGLSVIVLLIVAFIGVITLLEEGHPAGLFVAIIAGLLAVTGMNSYGDLKDLRVQAEGYSIAAEQRDVAEEALKTLTTRYEETRGNLISSRAELEAAKSNLENYKVQVANLTVEVSDLQLANTFSNDSLAMCEIERSELKGDLEVAEDKLERVRGYFKGGY